MYIAMAACSTVIFCWVCCRHVLQQWPHVQPLYFAGYIVDIYIAMATCSIVIFCWICCRHGRMFDYQCHSFLPHSSSGRNAGMLSEVTGKSIVCLFAIFSGVYIPVDCSKCNKSSKELLQRRSPILFFQLNGFEYHWYNRYDHRVATML